MMGIGEPEVRKTRLAARLQMCNGLTSAQRERDLAQLVPEPGNVFGMPVHYRLSDELDLTYSSL